MKSSAAAFSKCSRTRSFRELLLEFFRATDRLSATARLRARADIFFVPLRVAALTPGFRERKGALQKTIGPRAARFRAPAHCPQGQPAEPARQRSQPSPIS